MSLPLLPLLAAVASSFGWAGLDTCRKLLVQRIDRVPLLFLLTVASVPFFGVWALIEGGAAPRPGYLAPAVASVLLNLAANLAYFRAVEIAPLSKTVPLLSLTPVGTVLIGAVLLGERPPALDLLGILLVVAGALVLNAPRRAATVADIADAAAARASGQVLRGALLMALTALLWAATLALDKLAVGHAGAPFHGFVLTAGVSLGALGMLAAGGRLGDLAQVRRAPGVLALAVATGTLALGLQLVAIHLILVSLVDALKRGIGNVMAVVLGRLVFGERAGPGTWLAGGLMAAGVALIVS